MTYLHRVPAIRKGLDHLLKHDPVFSRKNFDLDSFAWEYKGPGYESLVRIVIGQQLSTKAAQSVWEKFRGHVGTVNPARVLKLSEHDMRALGLSGQKIKYITGLSEAVKGKSFDPHALEAMNDDDVHAAITALKGFGGWSAQMYLMFSLARPDVWPAGDLGVQEGLRLYLRKKERPDFEATLKAGKRFRPHATAASLLLWKIKDA